MECCIVNIDYGAVQNFIIVQHWEMSKIKVSKYDNKRNHSNLKKSM